MAQKINFSLTQIEYVLAVARLGHFSRAARECHVTQPTLSMQIQKLEEGLGTVIFDRTKKPVLLTEKGAELVAQMRNVLREARKIEDILGAGPGQEPRGELTVGIIPTVAPYLLPRLLPVLAARNPGLKLKLLELQTQRIVRALLEDDQIDLGILATPLHQPGVHERPLYLEPFSLLCRPDHKLAGRAKANPESLDPADVWLLEEGHCLRHQQLDLCSIRKSRHTGRQFEFESGSLETLKNLVSAYGGYTLLPALATELLPPHVRLIPFEAPVPAREIGLVMSRLQHKKALQDALADAILSALPPSIRKVQRRGVEVLPVA